MIIPDDVVRLFVLPSSILFSVALGCQSQSTPASAAAAPNAEAIAEQLRAIADCRNSGRSEIAQLPGLSPTRASPLRGGQLYPRVGARRTANAQAQAVMTALEVSRLKGLNPEDYDAERWPSRLNALKSAPGDATTIAHFDAALTVSAMRYISDLHIGRVNPKHFKFGMRCRAKKL